MSRFSFELSALPWSRPFILDVFGSCTAPHSAFVYTGVCSCGVGFAGALRTCLLHWPLQKITSRYESSFLSRVWRRTATLSTELYFCSFCFILLHVAEYAV